MKEPVLIPETFDAFVARRFHGVLTMGSHEPDSVACVLEAWSQFQGVPWTDNPDKLSFPDIRPLNDGPWSSDAVRTVAMISLMESLRPWKAWSLSQRGTWVNSLLIAIVRGLIAELPHLPDSIRIQCQNAHDLVSAAEAAGAAAEAAGAAARAAAEAAGAAARAAKEAEGAAAKEAKWAVAEAALWAARAAVWAARWEGAESDRILNKACQIWCETAHAIS